MRRFFPALLAGFLVCLATGASAATGEIVKVLPHYLDQKGRHTLSPSLFERDAYQSKLRRSPELVSALRFDINWRSAETAAAGLKLRVEIRGAQAGAAPVAVEETVTAPGRLARWTGVKVSKEQLDQLGGVSSWRVTLWAGDQLLGETRSFLW